MEEDKPDAVPVVCTHPGDGASSSGPHGPDPAACTDEQQHYAWLNHVRSQCRYFGRREISGCFGDLGTFLPLTIGLVTSVGLDLGTTLIFTGLYNIYSGIAFGVPIPVQPMKSIAAVAITETGFTLTQTLLAGILVSAVVFALGITGLIKWAQRLVPDYVIRGIQLGLGLKLCQKGLRLVLFEDKDLDYRSWWGASGLMLGIIASIYVLVAVVSTDRMLSGQCCAALDRPAASRQSSTLSDALTSEDPYREPDSEPERRGRGLWVRVSAAFSSLLNLPTALVLVVVGLVLTMIDDSDTVAALTFGPSTPDIIQISRSDWWPAFERGALPQLPLTILNSVVAVTMLSHELFPAVPISGKHVASSVGVMNLIGPFFGAMPCCHGAGGLAAQARFGAQSGLAPMMLGFLKLALGLLFGSSLFQLLSEFPEPLLGVMLVVSGAELASVAAKVKGAKREWMAMLMTAGGCFAKDTATGFFVGTFVAIVTCDWQHRAHQVRQFVSRRSRRQRVMASDEGSESQV